MQGLINAKRSRKIGSSLFFGHIPFAPRATAGEQRQIVLPSVIKTGGQLPRAPHIFLPAFFAPRAPASA